MTSKDAYQQKLEGKLHEWKADIDSLKAKAEQSSGDARIEYEKQLASLKKHRDEAADKLESLRGSSESAWEDIKQGAEDAWSAAEKAFSSARDKFK